jgi:two-component system, cell cycle sensor histidine kinase and response regulator CckA
MAGHRTILIVEDELPQLVLLQQMLLSAGYHVLDAKDGVEAMATYWRRRKEIDLVVCDMALPKRGGWSVYLSLKEMNPRVKMILASGYLDPKIKHEMVEHGVEDFVAKPYAPETLLTSIERALHHQ